MQKDFLQFRQVIKEADVILGFHSSPRPGGNLERMVSSVAQTSGLEHEIIRLAELEISPCTGCVGCGRSKWCVHKKMFQLFEDNRDAIMACERLGQALSTAVREGWTRPGSGGGFYLPLS